MPLSGNYSPFTWAKALLEQLQLPLTQQNVAAITAWEIAEGGHWHNTAHYNPLDTTMPEPGATSMNSVGVKAYVSWAQGFTATIATLRNGYYGGILAALRAGTSAIAVADAVAASPWGTGNFSRPALRETRPSGGPRKRAKAGAVAPPRSRASVELSLEESPPHSGLRPEGLHPAHDRAFARRHHTPAPDAATVGDR